LTALSEHLDDLIAEEKRAGHTEANAESAAWSRLGGTDRLLEALVARKDFLSWAHRAPWAVFLPPALRQLNRSEEAKAAFNVVCASRKRNCRFCAP
jgi:hypothetical protein